MMNDTTTTPNNVMSVFTKGDEDDEEEDFENRQSSTNTNTNKGGGGILRNESKRYGVVDRRQQQQQQKNQTNYHHPEQRLLLAERDDSDLEQNIGRLCQYLSGSEDDEEDSTSTSSDQEEQKKGKVVATATTKDGSNLQRPTGLFLLNSRHRPPRNSKSNTVSEKEHSIDSSTTSSSIGSAATDQEEQQQQMHSPTHPAHLLLPSADQQQQQQIPMQRLVPPRNFLNIPPPAQPPPPEEEEEEDSRQDGSSPRSSSSTTGGAAMFGRPLPPQRTLPPLPLPDEPVYEEAKPAGPPPPMPKPSKEQLLMQHHQNGSQSRLGGGKKASAVVSPVMMGMMTNSCHGPSAPPPNHPDDLQQHDVFSKPLYLSQGSQYNDIDWHNYETSVLERTEAGSFYIPSGQTTMSNISPSRKSEMEQMKRNNYLLSPSAQTTTSTATTIPAPILPLRSPDTTATNNGANRNNQQHGLFRPHSILHHNHQQKEKAFGGGRGKYSSSSSWMSCYSWKCVAYSLAAAMIFLLGVIIYLLYANFTSTNSSASSSPGAGSSNLHTFSSVPPYFQEDFQQLETAAGGGGKRGGGKVIGFEKHKLRPLPESFSLGDEFAADLLPARFAQTYFTLQRNSYVQFNLSLDSPQTKLAIYGRQTLPASPTQYDFVRLVKGTKGSHHGKRAAVPPKDFRRSPEHFRTTNFVQYLSGGKWHLSILNDDTQVRTVKFSASLTEAEKEECKNNCFNKGVCKEGKCYCFDGFTGTYCEESFCPVLCSGNGLFSGGKCHCHHGWKGSDCDVPSNVCEVPNCNGHGQCNNKGQCLCDKGYKGVHCEKRECPDENCSGHGVCHTNGRCYCDFGYKGDRCDQAYTSQGLCPYSPSAVAAEQKGGDGGGGSQHQQQCGGRGYLDHRTGLCICESGWLGEKCEKRQCHHLNCGPRGRCVNDACECEDGYAGQKCDQLACRVGCQENGKCENGTCRCEQGWNGENCQLAGCPNSCSQVGECKKANNGGAWKCSCPADRGGDDCSLPLERQCSDHLDNDGDGLVDCEDSECCASAGCANDQYCRTVPDPYQVLIRKPSPPPQATFFQKTSFLLDPESVQQYPDKTLFNESRVSVIRGRVVTSRGGSLMAVRIANAANALHGFTLSRGGGYFDLMVDGGGSITLQFMRKPFQTHYDTLVVPWNRIIYMGDVVMITKDEESTTGDNKDGSSESESCSDVYKDHVIKPYAVPSWKYGRRGSSSSSSGMVADAGAVQESLRVPGTRGIYLTYTSWSAVGRQSTLALYLVPARPPADLRLVHLTVDVEGVHFQTTLEAKANLSYVYGWDKRNVYKQQVIGLAEARVRVGYVYARCRRAVVWETFSVNLNGHVASIAEIGGWNLNVHHRYNILDSVLEKGDGGRVYLGEELSLLATTLGGKEQRQITCAPSACNGPASTAQLYLPLALASSRDGSLFVGDYNLIRVLTKNKNIWTVLELSISDTAHRYYLATHPITGDLYISLPLRRQIWKLRTHSPSPADLGTNYEVVVGSGEICSVEGDCGDGASAEDALLTYPKGIAFDALGNLYIADDRRIRLVSTSGFVSTVLGPSSASDQLREPADSASWHPLACRTTFDSRTFRPQWPTSLTFDYDSDALLFLDTDAVFELSTTDRHRLIRIRAGAPPHCVQLRNGRNETVRPSLLKGAQAVAWSRDQGGRILVAETDKKRTNRVRSIDRYGRIALLIGAESKCDCHRRHCPCDDDDDQDQSDYGSAGLPPGPRAHLHNPTGLAVDHRSGGSGSSMIHVIDQGNYKIKTLKPALPKYDSAQKLYEIRSPDDDGSEIYYFNRFGQHVSTRDTLTGRFTYNFTYHLDTSYGKLSHVIAGESGHKIYVVRKSAGKIEIENTNGLKSSLEISSQFDGQQMLEKFVSPTGFQTKYAYDGESNSGLLTGKEDSGGRSWTYEYDRHGRLTRTVLPTGEALRFEYGLLEDKLLVGVKNEKRQAVDWSLAVSEGEMKIIGEGRERTILSSGTSGAGDFVRHIYTPDQMSLQYDSDSTRTTSGGDVGVFRRKLTLPATLDPPRPAKTSKVEWRYYNAMAQSGGGGGGGSNRKRVAQVGRRKTRVNGVNVVTVEYDREKNVDVILNHNNDKILTVYYNSAGFVTQWVPASSSIGVLNVTLDQLGRVVNRNWGSIGWKYAYDGEGRVTEMADSSDTFKKAKKWTYLGTNTMPSVVQLPSGSHYELRYDPFGSLSSVISPSGAIHNYRQQTTTNTKTESTMDLLHYDGLISEDSDSKNTPPPHHRLSRRSDGSPAFTSFADGRKRIDYSYNTSARSRISRLSYDNTELIIDYHPSTGLLSSRRWVEDNGGKSTLAELTYGYQGDLIVEILDRRRSSITSNNNNIDQPPKSPSSISMVVCHWFYQYDDRLRIRSIQSLFDDRTSSGMMYKIDYDDQQRIASINGYQYRYEEVGKNKIRIQNEAGQAIETAYSPNMLIIGAKYWAKGGKSIVEQRFTYDNAGRMLSGNFKNNNDQSGDQSGGFAYEYNENGQLIGAKFSSSAGDGGGIVDHVWTYAYNSDGALDKVNDVQITYSDDDDRRKSINRYGSLDYTSDLDGFIVGRGVDEHFQYDSFGRLIRAWKSSGAGYDNRYSYDHRSRLISVHRANKSISSSNWHFYYGLLEKPWLITHAYDPAKRSQLVFTYDHHDHDHDRLISVMDTNNGATYLVVTHPNRTPLQIHDDTGNVVKRVIRSPFGAITSDTAPDLPMFIGYQGHYQDEDNGLVIFLRDEGNRGRPYDPNVGRFLSTNVERYFQVDPFKPELSLDPFLIDSTSVVIGGGEGGRNSLLDLDVSDWLRFAGFDTSSWLHDSPSVPRSSEDFEEEEEVIGCRPRDLLRISGECWLRKRISSFDSLLSVRPSALLPRTPPFDAGDRGQQLQFQPLTTSSSPSSSSSTSVAARRTTITASKSGGG